ncbi:MULTISPECIES: ABC-three component system middle component 6 [Bradyrhizobium]|uniref:ABC-three component system middle component 6 n=1 Tax=Bradyrhizobium TaxID=374 RepID=UPI00155E2380|nr:MULTISPECIES: ABC-three component system middle component 6 [Bradyrhizobium]MDD1522941.1 hypothetical protein [Bradyrhizobium sp. WBAH30]MDD1547020.1 hypothetical protein [Bradyrhizobium sp. WBAH41]MDD1560621.1 hypothetical protein [Bradyrhizobium sp. WBAH23]MDD1568090.1 hypothetical protein [Bradyrhizobium sp. WBAH33]MDD1593870.1 hypothetical protein [Bradyrhizobium sp. WBAH42]
MTALPNRYVPIDYSIVGLSSTLLELVSQNETVSSLWEKVSADEKIRTFDRFADALSLLFAAGLIDLEGGVIVRPRSS